MKDLRILLVDDEKTFCIGVERILRSGGFQQVRTASDAWQALELVKQEAPDLVLLDMYLPGMDGLHLMSAIHKIDPHIHVFMLTSESDGECLQAALRLGAEEYLVKPLQITSLVASLKARFGENPLSTPA